MTVSYGSRTAGERNENLKRLLTKRNLKRYFMSSAENTLLHITSHRNTLAESADFKGRGQKGPNIECRY